MHDDRGNAKVEWQAAPADYERTTLELDTGSLTRKPDEGYNPYGRGAGNARLRGKERPPPSAKRDLHKLSEWIKKMRELEERKKRGED